MKAINSIREDYRITKNSLRIDLLKYIEDVDVLVANYKKFKTGPGGKYLNLGINDEMLTNVLKAILLLDEKETNISKERLSIIKDIATTAHDRSMVKEVLYMLDTLEKGIESKEPLRVDIYKLLETAHITSVAFEISFALNGDGMNTPVSAIAYLINPGKVKGIMSQERADLIMEDLTEEFFDILTKESDGKKLYERLNNVINKFNVNKLSA
ncbi:hypothetical protein [Joostella sp. CR20]|uniref:hypothetical protein n=1 Tax=Joostella sp. CR20 TaxID=2804312 RepID=UPI00313C53A7